MTSKEKITRSLNHLAGPVPIDFGGAPVTGMHCTVVEQLRQHYGLERKPVTITCPYQMLGQIDHDLGAALGVDTIGIASRNTMFGFPATDWKEWRTPWGQDVLVPEGFRTRHDRDGILVFPGGDESATPSGKMHDGGYFFDAIIRQPDLDEDALDPADNTEEFELFGEDDLAYFEQECRAATETQRAVIANFGGTAIGDISMVPGIGLREPKGIRDVTEWYISTVARQDYLHAVFTRQTEIALENLKRVYERVGNIPDVVYVCGTDFGTQDSQFCSVETYRDLYHPYYARINGWIHEHTTWKTFKHTDGAIEPLLPDLIASGFDIVNPVQLSAAGMDARHLKETYGEHLVFWGGGTDTQSTLPFGTPREVYDEVLQRLEVFSQNGGYVFNAVHNVQAKTPVANVLAMLDAVKAFNGT
jgi:hypothetical protein